MGLLTTSDVAESLKVSRERVRQLVLLGKLRQKMVKGHPRFEEEDVEALRVERGGVPTHRRKIIASEVDLAIRAFDLFKRRLPLPAIVAELRLTPAKVRALYVEYTTPLGAGPKKVVSRDYAAERDAWSEEFERELASKRIESDREHQRKLKGI